MKNKILVIAAHPDDEVLGCGATMSIWAKEGNIIDIIIMAEGLTARDQSRDYKKNKKKLQNLKNHAIKSSRILGVNSINFCDFPDNRMDSIDLLDVIKAIENYILKFKPNILITHSNSDLNIDHRIIHEACVTATRPQNNNSVKKILCFEIPSSTEWNFMSSNNKFDPNYFVDVTGFVKKKIKALNCYKTEIRKWPHPRSNKGIQALANWRGATIGTNEAESFILLREITE